MRIYHVEVTFVNRCIDRFANNSPAMVQMRDHLMNFVQFDEIIEGSVTPPLIQIVHKWRSVNRTEYRVISADDNIIIRVTRVLDILPRCCGLNDAATHAGFETDELTLYIGACL